MYYEWNILVFVENESYQFNRCKGVELHWKTISLVTWLVNPCGLVSNNRLVTWQLTSVTSRVSRLATWPLQDIRSLHSFHALVNHPFIALSICIAHTIVILLHDQCAVYDPPPDPPCVCHTPYNIGNVNIVWRPTGHAVTNLVVSQVRSLLA